jgi:DNA (cytosine-5)-methyltransferase 1
VQAHNILFAFPCCQGHRKARGKAIGIPQHDASGSTAWAVVSAAEHNRPVFAVIENVPEFLRWSVYPAPSLGMEALGYCLSPHVVYAADHGVARHRERLFIVAVCAKRPLLLNLRKREHVPVSTFIDFTAGSWQPIEKPGCAPNTLARRELLPADACTPSDLSAATTAPSAAAGRYGHHAGPPRHCRRKPHACVLRA